MSFRVSYQPGALIEYESAIHWYLQRSEHAAENFKISVLEKIEVLRKNPYQYKRIYKKFHEVTLKKYPYSIIYFLDEQGKTIIISSIHHHKLDSRKKYK